MRSGRLFTACRVANLEVGPFFSVLSGFVLAVSSPSLDGMGLVAVIF